MFDEMLQVTKEKDRIRNKAYATIRTNLGNLNVELHGDRVSVSQRLQSGVTAEPKKRGLGTKNGLQLGQAGESWEV